MLHHQGLEELELESHSKTAVFDQIWLFLRVFFYLALVLLKLDGRAPNLKIWVLRLPPDPKTPLGSLEEVQGQLGDQICQCGLYLNKTLQPSEHYPKVKLLGWMIGLWQLLAY